EALACALPVKSTRSAEGGRASRQAFATTPLTREPDAPPAGHKCVQSTESPAAHGAYMLITSPRNEADFIERTIRSALQKTIMSLRGWLSATVPWKAPTTWCVRTPGSTVGSSWCGHRSEPNDILPGGGGLPTPGICG